MKLKDAVRKELNGFFKVHRKEVLGAIRKSLKDLPVTIIHFEDMDGCDIWCGKDRVIISKNEIAGSKAYSLDVYYSGDLYLDEDEITDKQPKGYNGDIVEFFIDQIGGIEKETEFYMDIYKKEIKEILKTFEYKKSDEMTFYIFKKKQS